MKRYKYLSVFLFAPILYLYGCGEDTYQPKPKGYFRIDLPEKKYQTYEGPCPYRFEYPVYAHIIPYSDSTRSCWFDIVFPGQKAQLHFSYFSLDNNLARHLEDSRSLAYKHTVKATNIKEVVYEHPEKGVYSVRYDIYGNTASAIQFLITDSTTHFLRGALYFSALPNADSLAPSIEFLGKDIDHLIETFSWKKPAAQAAALEKR